MSFEIYDWTLIATRPATADEVEYGCEDYDDCPDCNCGDDVAVVVTYARPRWSKSGKRFVEQTSTVALCSAHAEQQDTQGDTPDSVGAPPVDNSVDNFVTIPL